MTSQRGLYDLVITEALARSLKTVAPDVADTRPLDADEAPERLLEVLGNQLQRILTDIAGEPPERALSQLKLVNDLLRELRDRGLITADELDTVAEPTSVLRAIRRGGEPALATPDTGLSAPWLFTAGKGSPALLEELRREASGCDEIDILISFITVSGVRKLRDILDSITAGDATGAGRTRIRVLTTTYTGATEVDALDALARMNGCEVKVSLDGRRTRLHAKAWIFKRRTGFGSAYVGSANLSGAALMGGLEWTVKFTERGQDALFNRASAHFDTLWADDEFQTYLPDVESNRLALIEALRRESGESYVGVPTYFDIQPKHYQREMLEQLSREREAGRTRNLLVAATGTGKTVVAALDYRNTCERLGHRPRLLFVAHRAQILRQALRTYREVLRDHSFGEQMSGGLVPGHYDHIFASIDTLASRDLVAKLGADYWHVVVVDECHRIAASRFDAFATNIRPAQFLGLTATPERTDGQSIERYFDSRPDRAPAVELRLWDALDMQLLAPFEYYACDDETDFSEVPWDRPGETTAISDLVTGNIVRARMVINEWHRLASNAKKSKALVFCVSVAHARFMTDQFNAAGLPAACVVGETPTIEQIRAIRALSEGKLSALVTVDLFNEGVDLPSVDTLLLLRPTQSALLFQQQLGRGLRLSPGKDTCLILDFVGHHRVDFRFDKLLSAITGLTRTELIDAVENGFSTLPPACHIQLQRQTRQQVLRSLRSLGNQSWNRLGAELRSYSILRGRERVQLGAFLYDQRIQLKEVYRDSHVSGWTSLRRHAGVLPGEGSDRESALSRRLGDLIHLDDPEQIAVMRRVAENPPAYEPASPTEAIRAQMLTYQVDSSTSALPYQTFLCRLAEEPNCAEELRELVDVLESRSTLRAQAIPSLDNIPLQIHGAYRIREILTAVGHLHASRRVPFQAGVLALPRLNTELLFVTLDKSKGFAANLAFDDYAISHNNFHWQSQNSAGPDTAAGRRYVESQTNGWTFQLFVRVNKEKPYLACGPVRIVDSGDIKGNRPMSITWTLEVPLSAAMFRDFSVLR